MLNRHPEYQYLDLLKQVLERGDRRIDRTGVGTLSIFGAMTRFDVSSCAPILTTKRVYWKTAIKEMLWFLTGQTNIQPLLKENVRIWSDWPLARYRKETDEDISQEVFEKRISDRSTASNGGAGKGPMGANMIRSKASSTPCGPTRQAAVSCSMAGTSPKSIRWRSRPATWSTNSMSAGGGFRACFSREAWTCFWAAPSIGQRQSLFSQ
jgi:hypothetical protein